MDSRIEDLAVNHNNLPLYAYLGGPSVNRLPAPCFSVLNFVRSPRSLDLPLPNPVCRAPH